MIEVTLVSNNPRKTVIVRETKTIREVLSENNIPLNNVSVSVDGMTLGSPAELDKPIQEHTQKTNVIIGAFVNKDNAAKAIIMGSACVVKSELTPEVIKMVKKLQPEMLTMYDENDNPVFAIDIDEEMPGSLNQLGACFGNAVGDDGKATITVVIDPTAEDPAGLVEENFGHALLLLDEMEKAIREGLPTLREEQERIKSMITRL